MKQQEKSSVLSVVCKNSSSDADATKDGKLN